ncbi:TFIIA-alpha and beta-like factor [Triplophysa rosa]|uniref:TFIIA-alpha and beta-like factor n=1 Tax=Triplophysa rosa TaxID=992332 RepID=A0A9W7WMZ0_TRIRA|nr:TFIIA-alpha and beta-like factor [Triplophysa rosa]
MFYDEGVDERVLDNLRQLWESKVVQSKAVEGFIKDNNPANFVLQLPSNYSQTLNKPTVVIPAAQNEQNFTSKANNCCSSLATFSLPPGITYPVQIPAGVTLQTASGHFYKVNVPVMVTRGAQHILTRPAQNSNLAPVAPGILAQLSNACHPAASDGPRSHPLADSIPLPSEQSAEKALQSPSGSPGEFTLDGIDFSPQPLDMSTSSTFTPQPQGLQPRFPAAHVQDPIETPFNGLQSLESTDPRDAPTKDSKLKTEPQTDLNFSDLVDITQLDGFADSSSDTEEDEDDDDLGLVGENELLGLINANEEEEEEAEEVIEDHTYT